MKVILAGCGCAGDLMTGKVKRAVEKADLIIGAARMLEIIADSGAEKITEYRAPMILKILVEKRPERACVLLSGDSGLYSGAAKLVSLLEKHGIKTEVMPGISSVQYLAAVLKMPWQDWRICSAHGTECDPVFEVMQGSPVFFLTAGSTGPSELCAELKNSGLGDLTVRIGEDLGYENENIRVMNAEEASEHEYSPLNVVLADPAPVYTDRAAGVADEEFIRNTDSNERTVPMTKQETRALIASKLRPGKDEVCWDIGAGTGSVSIELAFASRSVYAVEKDAAALELIRQNREKFMAWNLRIINGSAPEALDELPAPDAVFIGGSSGKTGEILDAVFGKNSNARVCMTAVTPETLTEALAEFEKHGLKTDLVQIQASRGIKRGGHTLFTANNPVFIISGRK